MFIAHRNEQEPLLGRTSPYFEAVNLFKELMDYLEHAPEHERVEQLLSDISARLGQRESKTICLGLLKPNYKMIDAMMLFRHYGVAFSFETRKCDREKVIYAEARHVVQTKEEQYDAHEASYSRLTVKCPRLAVAA
jgi:hypothetical protein